jgi:hypothetical protein
MGLFLALSGVIGAKPDGVKNALAGFARDHSGGFEMAEGATDHPNTGVITWDGPNTTVMYPNGYCKWDDVSKDISEKLGKPVFSLHIHDGDLWMFVLFRDGREIGWFNPVPEYWQELQPEEKKKWRGDASLIAQLIPTVSAEAIGKYFAEWDLEHENPRKAYPDDRFTTGDCWQMSDFMKKIGLEYPMGDDGSIRGEIFRFWTRQFRLQQPQGRPQAPKAKKPWGKLW